MQYSLHVHSPLSPHLIHFSPTSTTFAPAEDPGTGIRTVVWAPGGRWVALGGWDGLVRIVESDGWRCVATLRWAPKTTENDLVGMNPLGRASQADGRRQYGESLVAGYAELLKTASYSVRIFWIHRSLLISSSKSIGSPFQSFCLRSDQI